MSVTIEGKDRPFGVLGAHTRQLRTFTKDDVNFLQLLGNVLATAIQRKQTEQNLMERENLLSEMSRIASIGAWEFDPITLEGTWTDEVAGIYDLDPEVEMNAAFGLSFFHGESRRKIESAVHEAIEQGKPYDLELEMITAKGNRKWVRAIGSVVRQGDCVVKVRGTLQNITRRKLAEEAVRESEHRYRELAAHLQSVREQERTHIAREIHDELGQLLTAMRLNLNWLAGKFSPAEKRLMEKTETTIKIVDTTIDTVRRIAAELRPSVLDLGLVPALEWQVKDFQDRTGLGCELALPAGDIALDQQLAAQVFRILQESLTNVARHAEATRIQVRLDRTDEHLILEVSDNGKGITEENLSQRKSLGLLGMHERAALVGGTLTIDGSPGQGTLVRCQVPLLLVRQTPTR